ncbi:MAG TPA: VWA domain-containing protein [Synergistaceae bacterium]|nr:VWA domain-containing protein [Synergistaceae bacterium]
MFSFASPLFLILLLLPVALWWLCRKRPSPSVGVPTLEPLGDLKPSRGVRISRMVELLPLVALLFLILGMARPQWHEGERFFETEGVSIMLGVDISQSMEALDFMVEDRRVTRLEALRGVVQDFLSSREGDRVGLVVFGNYAFTQLPLTGDLESLEEVLRRVHIGSAGPRTAIGDALGISLKRLEEDTNPSKVIILLTDGQNNAGELSPEIAASIAEHQGVRIYTIGMGTRGKAPYVVEDPFFGKQVVYRQVNIDEASLRSIAETTGGLYFRGTDTGGLEEIYRTISSLEKAPRKDPRRTPGKDLYPWFLGAGLLLLGCYALLHNIRYVRIPS